MDKNLFERIQARKSELEKEGKVWWPILAKEFGFDSGESVRKQFARAKGKSKNNFAEKEFRVPDPDFNDSEFDGEAYEDGEEERTRYVEEDDSIKIIATSRRIRTKRDVIEYFNIDTEKWKFKRFEIGTYEGFRKDRKVRWVVKDQKVLDGDVDDTGKLIIAPMVSTRSVLVPKEIDDYWDKEHIDQLFENFKTFEFSAPSFTVKPKQVLKNKLLIVPIADFHYGLEASEFATGNVYNTKLAEKRFYSVIQEVEQLAGENQFGEIWFLLGNDFLNSDNLNNTTTRGTPQDTAPDWFSLIKGATNLVVDGINRVRQLAPYTRVINVSSNHDQHSFFGIMETASAYYRNEKGIGFINSPLERLYFQFGRNLIGLSHDISNLKQKALENMSSEAKHLWSETDHKFWILAHLHRAMQYENMGDVEIYRVPTISGYSRWSGGKGFVNNLPKRTQLFTVDADMGIETIKNVLVR